MARIKKNVIVSHLQGAIGKQIVYRVRNGKTFASKYPDMSNVKPSRKQLREKGRFAEAVAYAQSINNNPKKKAAYKTAPGQTVFNAAIADYMNRR